MLPRVFAVCVMTALALTGCSSSAVKPNAADQVFLQEMIPHHERAIEVARIGQVSATDPRVRAFAVRIVREQRPELATMQKAARGLHLDLHDGAQMADHRIDDAQVAELRRLTGLAFDQEFLRLHIASEGGAAAMARAEDRSGDQARLLTLAKSIASAPSTQIPELERLLAAVR